MEGEDEALSSEKARLANVEKVGRLLSEAVAALESEDGGALGGAASARRAFQALSEIDPAFAPRVAETSEAIERLSDLAAEASRALGPAGGRPGRLARRRRAARRPREAEAEVRGDARGSDRPPRPDPAGSATSWPDLEGSLKKADEAARKAFEEYRKAALELSAGRAAAAPRLAKAVRSHLLDLAFPKASFDVAIARRARSGQPLFGGRRDPWPARRRGIDTVTFSFSPNPGEPARPLPKIASGGELARVQLALAAALAEEEIRSDGGRRRGPARTFVFDEVDAGVSGATAEAVGRKLRSLSRRDQVLVVTHLPQVAAAGERHLSVSKETSGGRTRTRVEELDEKGRVEAIASMLAGASVGSAARAQAKQLLSASR